MSERQAKLKRKNEIKEIQKKKKNPIDIVINIIIVVLVIAILAVGSWAVYNKFKQTPQQDPSAITDTTQTPEATVQTVAEYAQQQGKTADEFLTEYGLAGTEGVTAETLITDATYQMTLANYAAFYGEDIATLKESFLGDVDYSDDTLMSVIFEEQAALAENQAAAENASEEVTE